MSDQGDPSALVVATTQPASPSGEHDEMPLMIDRFVIEDELGAGGMGRVYVAYDPSLDRRVAVKVLRDRIGVDADQAYTRMAREARAMARLRHPNVVMVHEVGAHERGVFIVMEYVAGKTLRAWIEERPELGWKEIVATHVLAGRGLAAAHDAGLVHRDFKPDNALVGDDGRVLVVDFGIANVYGDDEAPSAGRPGSVVGTPPYMSPEQHSGGRVDARSDQFAFCAALYEALYGVRPFDGTAKADIARRALHGEIAPPVRDRGAPSRVRAAILRGLRADPAERFPSMSALLDELTIVHRSPVRRVGVAVAAALVAAAGLGLAVRETRAPGAAVAPPIGTIAVEPFDTAISYGDRVAWRDGVGDVIALLLADVEGLKAVGPSNMLAGERVDAGGAARALHAAEAKLAASYVVRGAIEQRGDRVYAHVVVFAAHGLPLLVQADRPATELANLLEDVTNDIAQRIAPGHTLDHGHATVRARALYAIGDEHLRDNDYQLAWPFLEQAVVADPKFFEAWYALALTRSWVLAPETLVFDASATARATASTDIERALVDGQSRFVHHDLPGARAILEPLITTPGLSKTEQRDALYLLGEAHWHDGHHRIGVGYFRRALDLDMRFKLPAQHLGEYATANRDVAMIQQYAALSASSTSDLSDIGEFVVGHYDALARTGGPAVRLYSMLVLGQTPPPELEAQLAGDPILMRIYRAARALDAADPATAHGEIDEIWKLVRARETAGELPDNVYYLLRLLGDVVLAGNQTDEVRRLVEFLAERSRQHPVRNYQRMSILAAPLVGDRSWIVRRNLTDRDRQLADAIEAEMTGDRARAVELLAALVHDPSPYWDYPERVALLRNLRALHRTSEARVLCDDTLHPAVFQLAFLAVRNACKQ